MELFKLFGSILVDDKEANKSISRTDKNAKSLGERLGQGIKTAAKWGAALVAGAGVAMGGMIALGTKVGNTADAILDLNSITGMSTDEIQKWRKATEVAGVSQDAVAKASEKFTKSLESLNSETSKGREALKELGYSLEDIQNMSADERMDALTSALADVDDKTRRAELGADLFGGTWKEIAPVVDLGREAMDKAKDSANIISEEDLIKANDFRITVANMKDQVGFFVTEIGIKLLPMLQGMFDWVQDNMPQIESVAGQAFTIVGTAISNVATFIGDQVIPRLQALWEWIEPHIPEIQELFETSMGVLIDLFGKFEQGIKWVIENMDILLPIIIGVTAAIVAQMVIDKLTKMYKVWQTVTKTQTTLQWLLNAALNANPLGLVALAIGAVIAAGVLLYKNWDTVKEKLGLFWGSIKTIFGNIKTFVLGVWSDIGTGVKGFINKIIGAMNGMIRGVNKIKFEVPDWVPLIGGKGWGFNLGTIPMLAEGGNIEKGGRVLVGERGPEFLDLPQGAKVSPLDHPSVAGGSGISFERGAFEGAIIFDDYGVDRLMERVMERMRGKTGFMT